jgi:hypothetical protein
MCSRVRCWSAWQRPAWASRMSSMRCNSFAGQQRRLGVARALVRHLLLHALPLHAPGLQSQIRLHVLEGNKAGIR